VKLRTNNKRMILQQKIKLICEAQLDWRDDPHAPNQHLNDSEPGAKIGMRLAVTCINSNKTPGNGCVFPPWVSPSILCHSPLATKDPVLSCECRLGRKAGLQYCRAYGRLAPVFAVRALLRASQKQTFARRARRTTIRKPR
jgi:hypothetical protein